MEENYSKFTAKQSRVIFPCHINDNGTLFGGKALSWMDEVAYITASNFTGKRMVTTCIEMVKFLVPIKLGTKVNVKSRIKDVGNVKLSVLVEITIQNPKIEIPTKAIEGIFVFSALRSESDKPTRLLTELG